MVNSSSADTRRDKGDINPNKSFWYNIQRALGAWFVAVLIHFQVDKVRRAFGA